MTSFLPPSIDQLRPLINAALEEDVGSGDVTSKLLVPDSLNAHMAFVAREGLIACGNFIPAYVYETLGVYVSLETQVPEGALVREGETLAKVYGPAQALLTAERVTLNLMQRMCGIATLTHVYVDAVQGTKAIILDTRKTMPGMRLLDKYAVHIGGGENHRMGLYDMVMIKDNHVALAGGVVNAVNKARAGLAARMEEDKKIILECDTLEQVEQALEAKPDRILLDNMGTRDLREAVKIAGGQIPLEASGGVSLETIRAIAETGVDYISVGKLTHSAPAADIGADIAYL